ncbi:hypothetical protein FPV67DRAFT_1687230 [Lyophyllum atratum]|nr:hypothetical protein FPV67DRAFT_1687230 [Lyophyllum atratum]
MANHYSCLRHIFPGPRSSLVWVFLHLFTHLLVGMLLLKSRDSTPSFLSPTSPKDQADLSFWEQLEFTFDMDNEPPGGSNNNPHSRNTRRTRSTSVPAAQPAGGHSVIQPDAHDAALLAQFAAAAGMASHGLSHANPYGSLLPQGVYSHSGPSGLQDQLYDHGNIGHTKLPPLSSLEFPWHLFPPQTQSHQSHQDQFADLQRTMSNPGTTLYPYAPSYFLPPISNPLESPTAVQPPRRASVAHAVASSSSASRGSPDPEQTEAERNSISEEKRRRNTAASARFRIKKKQRTTNLERSVSDLAGRSEDLEREAADLRRENGWLKEIVMLKGSRLAGVNLASHILAESAQHSPERSSQPSLSSAPSGSRMTDSGSNEASSEDEEAKSSKKKGKSRKK